MDRRTDRQTDRQRFAISISSVSVLTRDKNSPVDNAGERYRLNHAMGCKTLPPLYSQFPVTFAYDIGTSRLLLLLRLAY